MSNKDYIEHELGEIAKLETEARSILDTAKGEGREPSAEEEQRWDAIEAEVDRRKARIGKLEKADKDAGFAAEVRARYGEPTNAGSGEPAGDGQRTGIERRLIETMLDVQKAYHDGTRSIAEIGFDAEVRAIADFSDAASLYVDEFATQVAVYARTASPWLRVATVRTSTNGRPLVVPNITADATIYTPGEGTAITESTPTFGTATVSLTGYKGLAYVSMEADEDAMYDVMPYISRSQGRAIGLQFGSATTAAVLTAATNGGTATGLGGGSTATFIGLEDLWDLKYGLAEPYRAVGGWVMSNGLIKKAKKYQDKNGQYLWQSSLAAGQPPTFDGDPVYEDPYLAAPASATKSVLYGDLASVYVKQVPLRFAVSVDYRFATDEIALKAVLRAGAALPDAAAVAYIVSKAT